MAQLDENNHGGIGLFGDDEEQEQNYNDAADLDDILGLDDEDAADALQPADPEGSLLMRFCPHDSSMLYPKVRGGDGYFSCCVKEHIMSFANFYIYSLSNMMSLHNISQIMITILPSTSFPLKMNT